MRLLMIDNYDSFTYNLVQAFRMLGAEVMVHRNDSLTVTEADALNPTHLVVSPGPGTPENAGVSIELIRHFAGKIPVLGVCLGHQSIVAAYGGRIVQAKRLMHGKTSQVDHDDSTLFAGLPKPLEVGRYHSLAAETDTLPDVLEVTARTADGEVMGIRHRELDVQGVQFHPESVLTPDGNLMLANFLGIEAPPGAREAGR